MLDSLRQFLLVHEHGTLSEAAKHAHLSQPALTQAMQRLEERVGAKLMLRGRHGISLTAEGEVFLSRARASVAAYDDGVRAVAEVSGLRSGEVRVGAGATVVTYLLPSVLARFRAKHPDVTFVLRESTSGEALEDLAAGRIDLAVVVVDRGDLWIDDDLVLVAPPGLDPKTANFVTLRKGTSTRLELAKHFPEAHVVMELGSIAALKENVAAGVGIALVSRHAVERDLVSGRLVLVRDRRTPIVRPWHIVHRGLDALPPAASALRSMMLESRKRVPRRGQRRKRS
jgi:DNA-binding transcriptional LysR family regulator